MCFKFFATADFLTSHYKKRHSEYWEEERKLKENDNLMSNLFGKRKQQEFDEEDFLLKLREEVVDTFNRDFVKLHTELDALKKTSQVERVEDLLVENAH